MDEESLEQIIDLIEDIKSEKSSPLKLQKLLKKVSQSFEVPEEQIIDLIEVIKSEKSPLKLQKLLKKVSQSFEFQLSPPSGFYSESFDLFSEVINDSEFRSDAVGNNALTNPDVFRLLYEFVCPWDENLEVVLATSPFCPSDVLDELAESYFAWEEDGTTQTLARNQSNPELLKKLSLIDDSSTRYFVARNPATQDDVLFELAKDNGYCESWVYAQFFTHDKIETPTIKYAVISNNNVTNETLIYMLNALENFKFDPKDRWMDKKVVKNLKNTISLKLQNNDVVAENSNTPVEILGDLAKDEDEDVRRGVARNPNTSVKILGELAKDEDEDVRRGVAGNSNTSGEILGKLAKDEDKDVRRGVAGNPNTPGEVLGELAKDEDEDVRRGSGGKF